MHSKNDIPNSKGRRCNYFGLSIARLSLRYKTNASEDSHSSGYGEKSFYYSGISS